MYLPLPQLFLKLEHSLVVVVAIVKRCHAARHSEVKKSKDDRAHRDDRRTIDSSASAQRKFRFAYGAIRKTREFCGDHNRDSSSF